MVWASCEWLKEADPNAGAMLPDEFDAAALIALLKDQLELSSDHPLGV